MEYITAKQAALKWGITQRQVQNYCKMGSITGVTRMGRDWMIPSDASRPLDKRRAEAKQQQEELKQKVELQQTNQTSVKSGLAGKFPCKTPSLGLSHLYQTPGSCDELVASLAEYPSAQMLLTAQIACARGEIDKVYEMAEQLLASSDCFEASIGAGFILSQCAMYRGDLELWKRAKNHVEKARCTSEQEKQQLAFWQACVDSALYDNAGFSSDFRRGNFEFLPQDSFPAARFFYVKCLYLDFNQSVSELAQNGKCKQ